MVGRQSQQGTVLQSGVESNESPLVVAVIPAFNEEHSIAKVVVTAQKYADKVIVCDDGSTDLTAEIAKALNAEVIRHGTNQGYGSAIKSLLRRAREVGADVAVTLDGDGQHDPSQIPVLLEAMNRSGADIVVGSRFLSNGNEPVNIPTYRRYGIKAITSLARIASGKDLTDAQSGLRAYGRKVLNSLSLSEDGMGLSVEILIEAKRRGFAIAEVPAIIRYEGLARTSTQGPVRHALSVMTSISRLVIEDHPLQFLGLPGAVSILIGLIFGVWLLQIYAREHHIVTNIALASMTFTIIGLFSVFTAITLYSMSRVVRRSGRF